jgi:hypothetical protein
MAKVAKRKSARKKAAEKKPAALHSKRFPEGRGADWHPKLDYGA